MPITVGGSTVEVNMEILWEAAVEVARSKRKQKALFDSFCKKLSNKVGSANVPKALLTGNAKSWKGKVYELWDTYLDPLSANGKWGIRPLLDFEAILWDGGEMPTREAALETAVAEFRARAQKAAGAGARRKNSTKNLVHNKTCAHCGLAGQGNNKINCSGCQEPFKKPALTCEASKRSLPTDPIRTVSPLVSGFRPILTAVDKFKENHPGASAFAIAIVPVCYPSAAASSINSGPEVTNLMFDIGTLAGPAHEMLVSEYAGLKILVMRHASSGNSPAGAVANSSALISAVLAHARAEVKQLLEEEAARRPKEPAVPPSNEGALMVATDADRGVAIDEVLQKAEILPEVKEKLKAHGVKDLWGLKRLLRADNHAWQSSMGLGFMAVDMLRDAVSAAL